MNYLYLYIGCVAVLYLWEQYLRIRRQRRLNQPNLPDELNGVITYETYNNSRSYNTAQNYFGFLQDLVSASWNIATAVLAPTLWTIAIVLVLRLGLNLANEIYGMFFFVLVSESIQLVINLPLKIYRTFVIEQKFGFNRQTWKSFTGDLIKTFIVGIVVSVLMYAPMIYLIGWAGPDAWLYIWLFLSSFVLILNMAYPVVIAPLFNKFTPIRNPEIRKGIEDLVAKSGLSCNKLFEVDGSRQSSHSNAYVSGFFGTKRIVIYDTLIKDLDNDVVAIQSVVAHEIGHSILKHNWAMLFVAQANFFVMFFTFGLVSNYPQLPASFGFITPTPWITLYCFMMIYSGAVMPIFTVIMHAFTRKMEFQADAYSVSLGFSLRDPLIKIAKENLGDFNPDPLHSMWHHTHPPLVERLRAMANKMKSIE